MYSSIYQNSYVIAILCFIILSILFYIFEIGYKFSIDVDGKVSKSFNIKYPLAISLIVWLIWYFYLYPPQKIKQETNDFVSSTSQSTFKSFKPFKNFNFGSKKTNKPEMILENWK